MEITKEQLEYFDEKLNDDPIMRHELIADHCDTDYLVKLGLSYCLCNLSGSNKDDYFAHEIAKHISLSITTILDNYYSKEDPAYYNKFHLPSEDHMTEEQKKEEERYNDPRSSL